MLKATAVGASIGLGGGGSSAAVWRVSPGDYEFLSYSAYNFAFVCVKNLFFEPECRVLCFSVTQKCRALICSVSCCELCSFSNNAGQRPQC